MMEKHTLKVGDRAPELRLASATGDMVSLSDYHGRSAVVLFFYPKANTPFCTAEACGFRECDPRFREAGVEVFGVSRDSPEVLSRFADKFHLPFTLLSDPDGEAIRSFGVSRTFGVLPGRSSFLIDREGYIRHIFTSQFFPTKHVVEMLAAVQAPRCDR